MIDISFDSDRARLGRAMQHWYRAHEVYRTARRETIINYAGSLHSAKQLGSTDEDAAMWGNLVQMSGLAHMVNLAYNDPKFLVVAEHPRADTVAPYLHEALNKYAGLLSLGDKARAMATDSFCGYGIIWTDLGMLPRGVQQQVGQEIGPMCWRVSQDNFLFDGAASCWEDVTWVARFEFVPLRLAQQFAPFLEYNAVGAAGIKSFANQTGTQVSRVHEADQTNARATDMARLLHVYFPHTNQVCTWDSPDSTFISVQDDPLLCRQWTGHHTGPATVLSMIDIPDNLIPVARVESVKQLHFLFNQLADITAHQALEAKTNPLYEIGAQRDQDKIDAAADRERVGVANVQRFGVSTIPGPDQSQTSFMHASYQMFKEFAGNLDDTLGLGPTAATARQSELIRSSTSAMGAESRRRMDRAMEMVARKLAHLFLNDQTMRLHVRKTIPNTGIKMDYSWGPEILRNPDADDYAITIVPYSMEYRSPQARLDQLNQAVVQILQAAQVVAQGVPLELDKFIEIQAKYRDLPEIRELYLGLLPDFQAQKQESMSVNLNAGKPNGQYTRTNVSERTGQGALTEALTQQSAPEPASPIQLAM